MSLKPQFSLIIPTKDRGAILNRTVEAALQAMEGMQGEIIIVNDSEKPLNLQRHPLVSIARNPKRGVASARNHGARLASSELVIFMDDDFIIDGEALQLTLELREKYSDRIFLLNWTYPPETLERMQSDKFGRFLIRNNWTTLKGWLNSDRWNDEEPFSIPSGASYFLPLSKQLFFEIGGYNEQFPMAGFEDYDLPKRMMQRGLSFYIYPRKTIYHNEADRGTLDAFVARRKRSAVTQKVAVDIGYTELTLTHSKPKRLLLETASRFAWIFRGLGYILPNHRIFDPAYSKLVNILIAINIFDGYHS